MHDPLPSSDSGDPPRPPQRRAVKKDPLQDPVFLQRILSEPFQPVALADTPENRAHLAALEEQGIRPIDIPLLPAGSKTCPAAAQQGQLAAAEATEKSTRLSAPAAAPASPKTPADQSVPTAKKSDPAEGLRGQGAVQPPGPAAAPAVNGAVGQPDPANRAGALSAEDAEWIRNMANLVPHQSLPVHADFRRFANATTNMPGSQARYARHPTQSQPEPRPRAHFQSPPPERLPRTFQFSACLETYLSVCRPYQLMAPWDGLQVDRYAYLGPDEPSVALAAMMARHSREQLLASGLVHCNTDGELAIHSFLAAPTVGVIALRDTETKQWRDLVTEAGCLLTSRPPLFEVLGEQHTFDALRPSQRQVLLCDTLIDCVILRSLGLAAAPIAGLDRLNSQELEMLAEYYGIRREATMRELEEAEEREEECGGHASLADPRDPLRQPAATPPTNTDQAPASDTYYLVPGSGYLGNEHDDHVPLVIVQWSLHSLSTARPAVSRRAIQFLEDLGKYRNLQLHELMEWTPSDLDVEAIRFALARREFEWARDAVLDSLHTGVVDVGISTYQTKDAVPIDVAAAFERLTQSLLSADNHMYPERRRKALSDYVGAMGRLVTAPLLRQAELATDPLEKSLWLQLVELQAAFVMKAPAVREQLSNDLNQASPDPAGHKKPISEMLAMSAQLVALQKEIAKCRPTRPQPRTVRTATPQFKLSERFGKSDLVTQN